MKWTTASGCEQFHGNALENLSEVEKHHESQQTNTASAHLNGSYNLQKLNSRWKAFSKSELKSQMDLLLNRSQHLTVKWNSITALSKEKTRPKHFLRQHYSQTQTRQSYYQKTLEQYLTIDTSLKYLGKSNLTVCKGEHMFDKWWLHKNVTLAQHFKTNQYRAKKISPWLRALAALL